MPRNRSTFGHVCQRSGRSGWYIRVRLGGRDVFRKAGSDRKTAEAYLARFRRMHETETLLGIKAIPAVTIKAIRDDLLMHWKARHAASTYASDEQRLDRLIEAFPKTPLCDIDRGMVEDYLTRLRVVEGLSPATVNRYASLLSVVFRYAVDRNLARLNPVKGIRREKEELKPVPFISEADMAKLVASATDLELGRFIRLLSDTGLRRSEGLALQWRDIDLARRVLVVRRSKTREFREVPLTTAAHDALRTQASEIEVMPAHGRGDVWPGLTARRPGTISKAFKVVAKRADLPDLRLHDLRHGFACRLRDAGVPIQVIAQLAGHKALATTMRYSRHMANDTLQVAIATMESHTRLARRGA